MLRVFAQWGKGFRYDMLSSSEIGVEARLRGLHPLVALSPDLRDLPLSGRQRGLQEILPWEPRSLWHDLKGINSNNRFRIRHRPFGLGAGTGLCLSAVIRFPKWRGSNRL